MDLKPLKRSIVLSVFSLLMIALVLTSATYAWFTSNGEVYTSRVTAKTGDTDAYLFISSKGGADFKKEGEAAITQHSKASLTRLLPVSTSDLTSFLYNEDDPEGIYSSFLLDKEAERYYYGTVYIEAEATGSTPYRSMKLYLDNVAETAVGAEESLFANAGRIGLRLGNGAPIILAMSDAKNEEEDRVWNTYLNGRILPDGSVLHYNVGNSSISAVDDPAKPIIDYSIESDKPTPIGTIELNRVYELHIWYYLEGCDPDCSNAVRGNELDATISLFGILEE